MESEEVPRSRRAVSSRNSSRMSALEKLKQIRSGDTKRRLEIREEQNVYEMVDEDEYSDIVQKRLEDDWIIDDEGAESYVEDGREIFDDEYAPKEHLVKLPGGRKRKPISCESDIERPVKKGNIKNYFVQQQKREEKRNVDLDKDDFLNQLIEEVNTKEPTSSANTAKRITLVKPLKLLKRKAPSANPFEVEKPKADSRTFNKERKQLIDVKDEILKEIDFEDFVEENEEQDNQQLTHEKEDTKFDAVFGEKANKDDTKQEVNYAVPSANDLVNNLEYITEGSDRSVKVYWTDAYDSWSPGIVYFFGKAYVKNINKYVSCCLVVKNIERRVHVLVTGKTEDAEKEFTKVLKENYKISNFTLRVVKKFYAFEKEDVPSEAEYLEVDFPSTMKTTIPSNLKGNSFSCVFGTNQSSLERVLLDLKFKGPSWIKIKNPVFENIPTSWCKLEIVVNNFMQQMSYVDDQLIPPLTLISLKVKTYINPQLNQKEIIAISCLCNSNFDIECGSASNYDDHFCIITKPSAVSGVVLPYNFTTVNLAKMNTKTKIFVMGSERELLNFFMAKFFQIDADIIVGHDVLNFDLELIFGRLLHFKYGQWSKLGRFKRSELPHKTKDRIPVTAGRLVCDIKLSSKELIRLKDYELTELVAEILRKNRFEVEQKMMQSFYSSVPQLLKFINFLMVDTEFILSILQELNILPLSLQITKIAGNIMSRTLLGGRSERNEFLLAHAFHEKGYILPDKYSMKFKGVEENSAFDSETAKDGGQSFVARHKPAYTGGLVLEPKVGFYDQFILLMDFNSLYPSIIQEYNICFTTVSRKKSVDDDEEYIPEEPSKDIGEGILSVEIRKLVESRREVKKLLCQKTLSEELKLRYDVKQKALKLTANSMYGCLGFKNSRFYAKPLAALITFKGREILMKTKTMVENMGLEVIYGDTDSIMINTNCDDFDKCRQIGSKIQSEVNGLYNLLEIEIDGVFKRMLLLKKKKYACLTVKSGNSNALKYTKEIKGLDVVRRDWSVLAKKAGESILDEILSLTNNTNEIIEKVHNYLRDLGERIRNNDIPMEDYIISKQLTKNPEDYRDKRGLTHVTVAVMCNTSGKFEKKFRSGDTIPYIICLKENDEEDFNKLANTQRAFHPEMLREDSNLKVDIKYYLSQQVYPVVCRLCDPLEGTDRYSIAEFLGIEDCVENRRKQENVELDALVADSNCRFDTCKSAIFQCTNKSCKKEFEIRSTFTGDINKEAPIRLSLEKCPHCNHIFNDDSLTQLSNQLLYFVRSFINDYYKNWMTCEDPVCGHKSQAFTGPMTKRGPLCPRCSDSVLIPEITDLQVYLQIQFFNHIFDLKPYLDKFKSDDAKYSVVCSGQKLYDELHKVVSQFKSSLDFNTINLSKMFEGDYFQIVAKQLHIFS